MAEHSHPLPPATAPVDVVLFDLDDTLCEYPTPYEEHLDDAFTAAGIEPFFEPLDVRRHAGDVRAATPLEFRKQCFTRIANETGRSTEDAIAVAEAFDEPAYNDVVSRPGVDRAIEELGARYTLGLVTNTTPEAMHAKLDAIGLEDTFAVSVAQNPSVNPKPEPDMFEQALSSLQTHPSRAVHIGNSTVSDVAGAHAAGIRSVWIPTDTDGGTGPVPTYERPDLHALLADILWTET